MAPTVELPPLDALVALTSVVKRLIEGNRILKEKEKAKLTCEDYRQMRTDLNKQQFILPLDSDNTKASVDYIKQKLISCCDELR
ncbi:hypothetical protein MMC08_002458 [Hypocenomyce scalaris]|nr:hypothetical protein [Hypocenomyce scalaris]